VIAIVTGASRGIGKGAAVELGARGFTVYVTGRTVTAGVLPGTVQETAEEVTAAGGTGIAVACDHGDDAQVEALFDRVRSEHGGRLDVLVNNVYDSPSLSKWLGQTFWELPVEAYDHVHAIGTRSHYVAARLAAQLMVPAGKGVIVNVSSSGAVQYAHNIPYGVGKAALDRMTADMAHELRPHGVAVVSVWPSLVRTELVTLGGRTTIELPGEGTFDLNDAQSPRFVGRACATIATADDVLDRSGGAYAVADLARAYGFTEDDGRITEVLIRPN
jgi:dehydrogenase/reductase SDR family member 1